MKKVFLFTCAVLFAAASFAHTITPDVKPKISEKAINAFKSTFKDVENVQWSASGDAYLVKFSQQGINTYVTYDEEGNFLSSRRYYNGDQLPVDIQCALKKKYSGRKVYGVTEVTVGTEVNYYVKLEDPKTWITVKVDNARNMEVTEKYQKM